MPGRAFATRLNAQAKSPSDASIWNGFNETPELTALRDFIRNAPKLTEADQTRLLLDLLASEAGWLAALLEKHGTKAHERLVDEQNLADTRAWFRLRQDDQKKFFDAIRAARWDEVARTPINFRFVDWSRPHAHPTAPMRALERAIVSARRKLVESVLALIYKQSRSFHIASKLQSATLSDLIAIGTIGAMNGTDKYVPDGDVSAYAWKSVLLGRMLGSQLEFSKAQTVVHLVPTDERRLTNLRGGRVAEKDITDDDRELLSIGSVEPIMPRSSYVDNEGTLGFEPTDPSLNPEEALLAAEQDREDDRIIALAALLPDDPKPAKKKARKKHERTPIRIVETGEVFATQAAAATALGTKASHVSLCVNNGWRCLGKRLERVR